jgi:hypothetical protein
MSGADDFKEMVVAISPDQYYNVSEADDYKNLKKLKTLVKEKGISDGMKVAKEAKILKGKSLSTYKLVYDSDSNQLEPVYYWLLDFMQGAGIKVEKITDNFMSSPGSGHFSEMGQKASVMQQQATKILADTNTLIKTIINLVYDLKEYEIRTTQYERANSDDLKKKEEGMLALKNIWLDQVDLKRGRGSIHQMAAEMGFTTLREAFLVANTTEDVKKMAGENGVINDSVMRVLIPRLSEFLMWKEVSEKEIKKRFEIEKSYLKSEVESLKMYTKWARPYLKAAEELRMKGFEKDPALVSAFSTTKFELTLLGKGGSVKPDPQKFRGYKLKRDYLPIYIVSLNYRGALAQKSTQRGDYAFGYGGRVEITFDCYALNSEELELIDKLRKEAELEDGLKLVESNTQMALEQLKEDIQKYCGEGAEEKLKKEKEARRNESMEDDTNPFTALIKLFTFDFSSDKKEEKKKISDVKDIKSDNFVEKDVRIATINSANKLLYAIYDIYKKAHAMASSPESFDNSVEKKNDKPTSFMEFVETRKD